MALLRGNQWLIVPIEEPSNKAIWKGSHKPQLRRVKGGYPNYSLEISFVELMRLTLVMAPACKWLTREEVVFAVRGV